MTLVEKRYGHQKQRLQQELEVDATFLLLAEDETDKVSNANGFLPYLNLKL